MSQDPHPTLRQRWNAPDQGQRYSGQRFRSVRARERDPQLVRGLLAKVGAAGDSLRVLDLPCGSGRLRSIVEHQGAEWVGADISNSMLAMHDSTAPRLVADVFHLPLCDAAFDGVVCCRLLHHLDPVQVGLALSELSRVSRDFVIASFWDAGSLQALRRRAGVRWRRKPDSRRAISRKVLVDRLHAAGLQPVAYATSLRYWSPQTFVLARKDGAR